MRKKKIKPIPKKVAVIGGGAAGIMTSYLLQEQYQVTLFEKESRLGGHTLTKKVKEPGNEISLDVGFMVLNNTNYPNFHRFLSSLGLSEKIKNTEMSFSFSSHQDSFQYRVNWEPSTSFASESYNPSDEEKKRIEENQKIFTPLLREALRFSKRAKQDLSKGIPPQVNLIEYLRRYNYSTRFLRDYLIPLGEAIWSISAADIFLFPAHSFLQFFLNHGLLSLRKGPQWQYIEGGSLEYVKEFKKNFKGKIVLDTWIDGIKRKEEAIVFNQDGKPIHFDYVVLATHADQALKLLAEPTQEEKKYLGAWNYKGNKAVLHTSESVMPSLKSSWAAWNYVREKGSTPQDNIGMTYHLNRLQNIPKTKNQYFLSLNLIEEPPDEKILDIFYFTHPTFSRDSVSTQEKIAEINGENRTFFCGSYLGNGFHEDAITSGIRVAEKLGVAL